jgi:SAM-dependent methyltransferase
MFYNTGIMIHYWSCGDCGHIWTACLDGWTKDDFQRNIYNDDYVLADPPFTHDRPARNAAMIDGMIGSMTGGTGGGFRGRFTILDWGGGNGLMARMLIDRGYRSVISYDPFYGDYPPAPDQTFQLVTCFEVIEHVPDQRGLFAELARRVAPDGALLLSTLVQPADIDDLRLGWWYARPRNGHVRLHSRTSLELCLSREGFRLESLSAEIHVAFRRPDSPLVEALLAADVHAPSQPRAVADQLLLSAGGAHRTDVVGVHGPLGRQLYDDFGADAGFTRHADGAAVPLHELPDQR